MGMVLHGVAYDVGHLVVASVVHALHGVEYASLHRLETVRYVRYGTLEYHVRGVVQEPLLIHAGELASATLLDGKTREAVHVDAVGLLLAFGIGLFGLLCGIALLFVENIFVFYICHLLKMSLCYPCGIGFFCASRGEACHGLFEMPC